MEARTIDVPEKAYELFGPDPAKVGAEIRTAAAMMLYQMGRISSGAAAELADIPKTVFLTMMADYGVDAFNLTIEDILQEKSLATGHLRHVAPSVSASDRGVGDDRPDVGIGMDAERSRG